MSVELHIRTRGRLRPDPECDPVLTIFYHINHDYPSQIFDGQSAKISAQDLVGVIAIDIENCGFQGIHVSRETKKNASPWKQFGKQESHASNVMPQTSSNQNVVVPGNHEVQSLQGSTCMPVGRGYLCGCVSGEDVKVTYVRSESELLDQLVAVVHRYVWQNLF